jgi:hypothetical protein
LATDAADSVGASSDGKGLRAQSIHDKVSELARW